MITIVKKGKPNKAFSREVLLGRIIGYTLNEFNKPINYKKVKILEDNFRRDKHPGIGFEIDGINVLNFDNENPTLYLKEYLDIPEIYHWSVTIGSDAKYRKVRNNQFLTNELYVQVVIFWATGINPTQSGKLWKTITKKKN